MTFDHRAPGTDEDGWLGCALLAEAIALPAPESDLPLLVLAAHPDDETLGAGGVIAAAAAAGRPIVVVVASDGEASHPNSPTYTPEELAGIRRHEVTAALRVLAPRARLCFLGLPDGRLDEHVAELEQALRGRQARGWLVAPWQGDRHPDHAACATAARRVAASCPEVRLYEYPIWAWHWGTPTDGAAAWAPDGPPRSRLRRFDLDGRARSAKSEAMNCHRSQTQPLSQLPGDEPIVPPNMMAHFDRPFEVFVEPLAPAAQPAYFDRIYAEHDDPWGLRSGFYEQRKREILLSCLPAAGFRRGFEPGCAIGLLTEQLAKRCDELVATDVAEAAVEQARSRVTAGNVRIEQGQIPQQWPAGPFDLIVLSEVGYYCPDLSALRRRVLESLTPDGTLLACHWRHPATDHPHDADSVHGALGVGLHRIVAHREDDFRLDVWSRRAESVASRAGLLD